MENPIVVEIEILRTRQLLLQKREDMGSIYTL